MYLRLKALIAKYLNSLVSIGQTVTGTVLTNKIANTTKTSTNSVTVSKGTWLIVFQAALPLGTGKQFQATITPSGEGDLVASQPGVSITGLTRLNVTAVYKATGSKVIYGTMYHNNGSAVTINTNYMLAVRIGL